MRGRGPLTLPWCPKEFAPSGLRHFSDLAVSPSLSVALRLAGRWGPRNPIKPALGSLRSSENWPQRGIREFFNSLLGDPELFVSQFLGQTQRPRLAFWDFLCC